MLSAGTHGCTSQGNPVDVPLRALGQRRAVRSGVCPHDQPMRYRPNTSAARYRWRGDPDPPICRYTRAFEEYLPDKTPLLPTRSEPIQRSRLRELVSVILNDV